MTRPRLALAVTTAVGVVLPLLAASGGAGATAATPTPASVATACETTPTSASASASARTGPGGRDLDHPSVDAGDLAALDTPVGAATSRMLARVLDDAVVVPVHVVLVRGKHRGDTAPARTEVPRWMSILDAAHAGGQSATSAPTRFSFSAASVRTVKNDAWYHAVPDSRADRAMRRALHRGGPDALNLYVTRPGGRGDDILGFARFPWQYAEAPLRDGVTVHRATLPGGSMRGYDQGDTLVHEVGHWLGLFHTFEGGCRERAGGDKVADTPTEAEPSFYCQVGRNTCAAPGDDPVHNFMDYSYDTCMDEFTPGQVARMDLAYERYRVRR